MLDQYGQGRGGFVSIYVGYAPHSKTESLGLVRAFSEGIAGRDGSVLAATIGEVDAARESERVGVVFDLEDCRGMVPDGTPRPWTR